MMHSKTFYATALIPSLILAGTLLTGCGTRHISKGLSREGIATEVVFPDPDGIVMKGGTFPNLENLRSIGPGVTKDQLYHALGRPHFREALYGVREWDYLFHFHTPAGIKTCQYKILFDADALGQSFHWAPASCADLLVVDAPAHDAKEQRFEISADALFAFGKSGEADILERGQRQLLDLAARLRTSESVAVRVVGHTDRIGSDAENLVLSQLRAETVVAILARAGVPASAMRSEGRGEREPVTRNCSDALPREVLINCLLSDRRVELFVTGLELEP